MQTITPQQLSNLIAQKKATKIKFITLNATTSIQELAIVKRLISPTTEKTVIIIE
jgi:hypothetical protein